MSHQSLSFSAHSVDTLSAFTMADIVDYIPSMAIKWMAIGLKLGQTNLVRSLKHSAKSDETKLMEILMEWEVSGSASWQVLIEVLNSTGVQLVGVVKEIKQVRNNIVKATFAFVSTFIILSLFSTWIWSATKVWKLKVSGLVEHGLFDCLRLICQNRVEGSATILQILFVSGSPSFLSWLHALEILKLQGSGHF